MLIDFNSNEAECTVEELEVDEVNRFTSAVAEDGSDTMQITDIAKVSYSSSCLGNRCSNNEST